MPVLAWSTYAFIAVLDDITKLFTVFAAFADATLVVDKVNTLSVTKLESNIRLNVFATFTSLTVQ